MPNRCLLLGCAWLCLSACSAQPHIQSVASIRHRASISETDVDFFQTDRASRIRFAAQPLPADGQREEFRVRWHGKDITRVRFEYRQVNIPNQIHVQEFRPTDVKSARFEIHGQEFQTGGVVSAWRCVLLRGDAVVAERQSTLW